MTVIQSNGISPETLYFWEVYCLTVKLTKPLIADRFRLIEVKYVF